MSSQAVQAITLNQLDAGLPGLSKTWGGLIAEAGAVCFERKSHTRGVNLKVKGMTSTTFQVYWNHDLTEQIAASWDDDEMIEFGACAVAILLVLELTSYTVVRRARKGEGVDYWLGYKNAEYPFQETARLEVSGILEGKNSAITARVKAKKEQTRPTDGATPAYVIVVEFSNPLSHVEQK
jgi:hypothetical protein